MLLEPLTHLSWRHLVFAVCVTLASTSGCQIDGKHFVGPATDGASDGAGAGPDGSRLDAAGGDVSVTQPGDAAAPGLDAPVPMDAVLGADSAPDISVDVAAPQSVDACLGDGCAMPDPPVVPAPVACQVSGWSQWTPCDRPCGGGMQTRTRTVAVPASNGGAACPSLLETQPCNLQACATDCQLGPWTEWSACTKPCGGGSQMRTRAVVKPSAAGGAPCGALSETRECNTAPANGCGGCSPLSPAPQTTCGVCGTAMCAGPNQTVCKDLVRTCAALGATCGAPPDGCGGRLDCGGCADPLTSCSAELSCRCGKPTGLNSPTGPLETGKRAVAPGGQLHATSEGVFDASGTLIMRFMTAKGFDWHPTRPGRFAVMHHFDPPQPLSVIEVYDVNGGQAVLVGGTSSTREWHHYLAWADASRIALGGENDCRTVATVVPQTTP